MVKKYEKISREAQRPRKIGNSLYFLIETAFLQTGIIRDDTEYEVRAYPMRRMPTKTKSKEGEKHNGNQKSK